ncbi:Peptidoglycan/xylan/chitin deacetylase, PgdA/CDA1 family [Parapedobacter composti]|uniref:Peptidoglycan/xylan/chitin deacetylase, PgdA/CDA1 family n=1 Tax=Parapedobacter composti TaxID=623281 RepID=A0A1I1JDD7_9SPHI|nr:polysaccharide deacetylase family protein [Parapedobacter composti]SFC43450.1 Peptidoglycan/xylan/chitin deacetylase, PgdA/CDA1 family [Parapedobacter composti]
MHDAYGGIIRGDTAQRKVALVFTADEYGEGASFILDALHERGVKGGFFLTGNYLRDTANGVAIRRMVNDGHYVGPHSDRHLLYCDWQKRDSLLVSKADFMTDLAANYRELTKWGVNKPDARFFIPPYEWYNRQVVAWSTEQGVQLVNFTPGLRTAADYTYPEMGDRYMDSAALYEQVLAYEARTPNGLNGFIILVHLGTDVRRKDKFYHKLPGLIKELTGKGYVFERIDKLIQ